MRRSESMRTIQGEGVRCGLNRGAGFEYDGSLLCGIWEMSVHTVVVEECQWALAGDHPEMDMAGLVVSAKTSVHDSEYTSPTLLSKRTWASEFLEAEQ